MVGRLVDWSDVRTDDWWVGQSVGQLVGWSVGRLVGRVDSWLVGWLVGWSVGWSDSRLDRGTVELMSCSDWILLMKFVNSPLYFLEKNKRNSPLF